MYTVYAGTDKTFMEEFTEFVDEAKTEREAMELADKSPARLFKIFKTATFGPGMMLLVELDQTGVVWK